MGHQESSALIAQYFSRHWCQDNYIVPLRINPDSPRTLVVGICNPAYIDNAHSILRQKLGTVFDAFSFEIIEVDQCIDLLRLRSSPASDSHQQAGSKPESTNKEVGENPDRSLLDSLIRVRAFGPNFRQELRLANIQESAASVQNSYADPMKAGPFGTYCGQSHDELKKYIDQEVEPFLYAANHLPKSHSSFSLYGLRITPINGLSWIKCIGKEIQTDRFGQALIQEYVSMREKLIKAYGKYEDTDFIVYDSIWNESKHMMESFIHKDRFLHSKWSAQAGSLLNNKLSSIFLMLDALSMNSGRLVVEYAYENSELAQKEIDLMQDDAL